MSMLFVLVTFSQIYIHMRRKQKSVISRPRKSRSPTMGARGGPYIWEHATRATRTTRATLTCDPVRVVRFVPKRHPLELTFHLHIAQVNPELWIHFLKI